MRVCKQKYKDRKGKTRESKKWYVEFKDHLERVQRIPGFTDKGATQEFGRRIEKLVALRAMGQSDDPDTTAWLEIVPDEHRKRLAKCGLLDPNAIANAKPLLRHLEDYIANLRHKGRSEDYVKPTESRIRRIAKGCRFQFISDISGSRVEAFLAELKDTGSGQSTVNHYLRAVKTFAKWLVTDRRTTESRLVHLKAGNAKVDVRRQRRELLEDELRLFLDAASNGVQTCGLTGRQRFLLYVTALSTGLRASELASLTPAHFDLESNPPTVRIDAKDEKTGRGEVLPLPPDMVELIRPVLRDMPSGARLWPGTWAKQRHGSKWSVTTWKPLAYPTRPLTGRQTSMHSGTRF